MVDIGLKSNFYQKRRKIAQIWQNEKRFLQECASVASWWNSLRKRLSSVVWWNIQSGGSTSDSQYNKLCLEQFLTHISSLLCDSLAKLAENGAHWSYGYGKQNDQIWAIIKKKLIFTLPSNIDHKLEICRPIFRTFFAPSECADSESLAATHSTSLHPTDVSQFFAQLFALFPTKSPHFRLNFFSVILWTTKSEKCSEKMKNWIQR